MASIIYQTLTAFFGLMATLSILRLLIDFILKRVQKLPRR